MMHCKGGRRLEGGLIGGLSDALYIGAAVVVFIDKCLMDE